MSNDVRFRTYLEDKVSGGLKNIHGGFDKLDGKMKGVGKGLGALDKATGGLLGPTSLLTAGVLGLAGAGAHAVMAFAEEEVGIAALGASLKANIPNWDGNTDAIERTIAAREDLAFSDDELRKSLQLLVASTHDVNKAWELQSTAMDLARFKSISLEEATTALIKIEGGSFKALKALIGSTKDIKTAEEALAAVRKVAAGAADTYASTSVGKIKRLGIAWQDLQENAGGALVDIGDGLGILASELNRSIDPTAGLTMHMEGLVKSSRDMVDTTPLVGTKFTDMGSAAYKALHPVETETGDVYDNLVAINKSKWGEAIAGQAGKARTGGLDAISNLLGDMVDQFNALGLGDLGHKKGQKPRSGGQGGGLGTGIPHAAGGRANAFDVIRVGEKGPETLVMGSRGGYVYPYGAGGGAGASGSPQVIQLVVDGHILAQIVSEHQYGDYSRSSPSATRK